MAVPREEHLTQARVLALLGMVNAAIGAWYYLRVITVMYLRNSLHTLQARLTLPALATLTICVVLTIGLSVPPGAQWLIQVARDAARVP
jgi:NADH-quinone oxidoreductase subunit N